MGGAQVEPLDAVDGLGADRRRRARLRGRSDEVGEVVRAVDGLTAGQGGALVVRGDCGIGKSALLDVAVEQAHQRSVRVLAATGVQAETQLPFAGLHQLLEPVLDLADLLPQQQRNALLGAFGIVRDGAADPFLTALATLELIAEAAAEAPVLLVAEDAQWLDQPSCAALSFVAPRLETEPALILIAMPSGHATAFDGAGLAELRLGPLDDVAAAAVLGDRSPGLDAGVRAPPLGGAPRDPLPPTELPVARGRG